MQHQDQLQVQQQQKRSLKQMELFSDSFGIHHIYRILSQPSVLQFEEGKMLGDLFMRLFCN